MRDEDTDTAIRPTCQTLRGINGYDRSPTCEDARSSARCARAGRRLEKERLNENERAELLTVALLRLDTAIETLQAAWRDQ